MTNLKCGNSRGGFHVKLMSLNLESDEPIPNDIINYFRCVGLVEWAKIELSIINGQTNLYLPTLKVIK
ncbi:MAG: hypothetical protein F6K24_27650 [Okeania sp. SIO2D1]|nr:hypothetical protein [Okeania sp. SIO2D1]